MPCINNAHCYCTLSNLGWTSIENIPIEPVPHYRFMPPRQGPSNPPIPSEAGYTGRQLGQFPWTKAWMAHWEALRIGGIHRICCVCGDIGPAQ